MARRSQTEKAQGAPAGPARDPMADIHKFSAIASAVLMAAGALLGFAVAGLAGAGWGAVIGLSIMAVPMSIFTTYAGLGRAMARRQEEASSSSAPADAAPANKNWQSRLRKSFSGTKNTADMRKTLPPVTTRQPKQ